MKSCLKIEKDETKEELNISEERAQAAMLNAAKLANKLRNEINVKRWESSKF